MKSIQSAEFVQALQFAKRYLARFKDIVIEAIPAAARSAKALARFLSASILALLKCFKWVTITLVSLAACVFVLMVIGNSLYATPRDKAYRNLHPQSEACLSKSGWAVLSAHDNDELKAIQTEPHADWGKRFQCTLQLHSLPPRPNASPNSTYDSMRPSLSYYLGFLEFTENGSPQSLVDDNGGEAKLVRPDGSLVLGQYAVLRDHLRQHDSNFVVAFVHGWRHDASLGDGNVRDARHYGAHVARFLADRCEKDRLVEFCGATVTVIYVGWRGARVNETKLKQHFGTVGEWLGTLAAIPTLFDRKPVSEEVGPSVVTALRGLYNAMPPATDGRLKKMVVFGHSLGGNLLVATLKDYLLKMVDRHQTGRWLDNKEIRSDLMNSPIGDLVVLINPASEAANWTAIQRAIWNRIPYRPTEEIPGSTLADGHVFFRQDQPPILISVTAAHSWPPSGLRQDDCIWLRDQIEKGGSGTTSDQARKIWPLIEKSAGLFKSNVQYDWATYDLFPMFRFDLRPIANTVQRFAERLASRDGSPANACSPPPPRGLWTWISKPVAAIASILRNTPFMNTDREQTRTIGHLDPPRPPMGNPIDRTFLSFRPLGTTHELVGNSDENEEPLTYSEVGVHPAASCTFARGWLWNARQEMIKKDIDSHGMFWDSADLAPSMRPAARFLHSFANSGTAAVTRANDPFWNVRAFDTALSRHDGYLLSSFICAMNQIVMDDIATVAVQQ